MKYRLTYFRKLSTDMVFGVLWCYFVAEERDVSLTLFRYAFFMSSIHVSLPVEKKPWMRNTVPLLPS